jgi:hypothetical protein
MDRRGDNQLSAGSANITEAAQTHLVARLSRAREAAQLTTAIFIIGSLLSVLAFIGGAALLRYGFAVVARSERTLQGTLDSVREGAAAFDGSASWKHGTHHSVAFWGSINRRLNKDRQSSLIPALHLMRRGS